MVSDAIDEGTVELSLLFPINYVSRAEYWLIDEGILDCNLFDDKSNVIKFVRDSEYGRNPPDSLLALKLSDVNNISEFSAGRVP